MRLPPTIGDAVLTSHWWSNFNLFVKKVSSSKYDVIIIAILVSNQLFCFYIEEQMTSQMETIQENKEADQPGQSYSQV